MNTTSILYFERTMNREGRIGIRPAGGKVGDRENTGPLVGYVPVYRTCYRRRAGRMNADPFRDTQYPERTELWF